jgi:hypothetical protein
MGLAVAGLWFILVSTFSQLTALEAARSAVWHGVLFLAAAAVAAGAQRRIEARGLKPGAAAAAHGLAALAVAAIWTLPSLASGAALTDWFLEGELERFAVIDRIESVFDAAEEDFPSDPGWFAYKAVAGLAIYAFAAVLRRGDRALARAADLEARVRLLSAPAASDGAGATLVVKDRGADISIRCDDIILLEGERDYVRVHTAARRYLVRHPLAKFEAGFGAGPFLRIHRSRIVNLAQIESANPLGDGRGVLRLAGGLTAHTSRDGWRAFKKRREAAGAAVPHPEVLRDSDLSWRRR